jgi:copper resistance protein B
VLLSFAVLSSGAVWAETTTMPAVDHSQMNMDDDMSDMDHSKMKTDADNMNGMDHSKMDMSGGNTQSTGAMDHGDMQMQGGTAPPDARDPHAYAAGQGKGTGDYALPGIKLIRMADQHSLGSILFDRLERVDLPGDNSTAFDLMFRYGRDYNKLVIKSEGEFMQGKLEGASSDVLWSHAIAAYWDAQLGMSYDYAQDLPSRSWLAAGVQGLAPYWFEIDVTAYVGNDSRTALSVVAEYELLITQKLILQPRLEANLYGKDDPLLERGKGLANATAGIRLRYEIKREFAPYIGVEYTSKYGNTADMARTAGAAVNDTRLVAGLRFWY